MNKYIELFWTDITTFGGLWFYLFMAVFAWIIGNKQLTYQLLLAVAISLALIVLVRTFYYRERPKKEPHKNYIDRIYASSFPSLHAMRAVILPILFGMAYNNWLTWVLFSLIGLFILVSRHILKKHHPSDIIVGSILGGIVSYIVILLV